MKQEKLLSEGQLLPLKARKLPEMIPTIAELERNTRSAIGLNCIDPFKPKYG